MKNALFAALVAASATLAPQHAQAQSADCTLIESLPATIGASGKYCLVDSHQVDMTTGNAITIAAPGVTLDCRGHTIFNDNESPTGASIGVYAASVWNVVVRNCRIGGFTDGIHIYQPMSEFNSAYYNQVEDNYIFGPFRYGIVAYGSAVEVRDNVIWDVGGQATGPAVGIRVGGAAQSQNKFQIVEGNSVIATWSQTNHAYAIFSDGSVGSIFRDNTISGTAALNPSFKGTGIRVGLGSGLTVRDNHVSGRGNSNEVGIQIPANGGKCFHNRVATNPTGYVGCDVGNGNY